MASSEYNDVDLDEEARLACFAAGTSASEVDVHGTSGTDLERTPDSWSCKRNMVRYNMTLSTGDQPCPVKRNLRRVSLRVVNLAGAELEEKAITRGAYLPDDEDDRGEPVRG